MNSLISQLALSIPTIIISTLIRNYRDLDVSEFYFILYNYNYMYN